MKRPLTLVCLFIGLNSSGQEAPSTNAVSTARPVYRYLFLIDTSSTMSRQKAMTTETVSKLILSSIAGRIQPGDTWGLWTFDDQIRTNVFPALKWDPRVRREIAAGAYRFLNDQRFKKKNWSLEKPLAAISDEAKLSGDLTVFLFTDGSRPVKGTPFDNPINEIFKRHAPGMRKAKKPFVTVLVAQEGTFAAQAVNPGGESIYVPRLASATSPDQANAGTKLETTTTNAGASAPAASTKPMTVEEIAAALRQSQKKQTNAGAVARAPLIMRGTNVGRIAPDEAGPTNTEIPAPILSPSPLASDAAASENRSAAVSNPSPPAPEPAVLIGTGLGAPAVKSNSAPAETRVAAAPKKVASEDDVAPAGTTADNAPETAEPSSASPQTALLLQPEPAANAWKYLTAAAALLLVALTLAWFYIRSIRYVPRPSLISRSMEKERK